MKRPYLFLPLLFVTLLFCRRQESPAPGTGSFLHVRTAPVIRMSMADTVRIYGRVELRRQAYLASQFDGRLSDFSLLMGDRVRKGRHIATIIPAGREALLQTLETVDANTRIILEKQFNTIPLTSPIDGEVLEVLHYTGDVVQKGEAIAFIGDLDVLDVYGDLPVRYIPLVRRMKHIAVTFTDISPDPVSLPVMAVSGRVDEKKQTLPVRLELDNSGREYRPGMRVQLLIPDRVHESVLAIPRSALLEEEGIFSVFVVKNGKAEKRMLQTGIAGRDWVEVQSGLAENEPVVTDKAYSLTDGMEVVAE